MYDAEISKLPKRIRRVPLGEHGDVVPTRRVTDQAQALELGPACDDLGVRPCRDGFVLVVPAQKRLHVILHVDLGLLDRFDRFQVLGLPVLGGEGGVGVTGPLALAVLLKSGRHSAV